MAVVLLVLGSTLYNIQKVNGDYYYEKSQTRIAETETVESARGNILDSSGRTMVSNSTIYQVTLDTSLMGKEAERNATILSLIRLAQDSGV